MHLHYLQHVPFEMPGTILEWATEKGARISSTLLYKNGAELPEADAIDFLVVMGGPMGVYDEDEYPWIAKEKQFLKRFIQSGKPVLGVCLGAQFIADALGAKIYKGVKEIGWMPVFKANNGQFFQDFPEKQVVMHWHGDTFDLPENAVLLASSNANENQAFEYKNCLGLQFHFEMEPENIRDLLENAGDDLVDEPYVQTREEIESEHRYFNKNRVVLFSLLDRLAEKTP